MKRFQIVNYEKGFNSEIVVLEEGELISNHWHIGNLERLEVLSGALIIETENERRYLRADETFEIPRITYHTLKSLGGKAIFVRGVR